MELERQLHIEWNLKPKKLFNIKNAIDPYDIAQIPIFMRKSLGKSGGIWKLDVEKQVHLIEYSLSYGIILGMVAMEI